MNNQDYFTQFMITKTNMKIIKEQQRLYMLLTQFLNRCNGEYYFYKQFLKELQSLYVNVIHNKENPNAKNVENINRLLLHLIELKTTKDIRQYVDDCYIMEFTDLDLLSKLCDFLEENE